MESDLAPGSAPAVTASPFAARMARPAHLLRFLLQHGAERLDPGGQAETLETRGYFLEGLTHRPARHGGRIRAKSLHGVAFLSWNQHPEPTGSRRATPLLLFQHPTGHPRFVVAVVIIRLTTGGT